MRLEDLIKQEHFADASQRAMLEILVTGSWANSQLVAAMAPFKVTPAQYNVLRILRGSSPERMTCSAIGSRLLDRTPDVTRLLNRLEKRDLVVRERSSADRRVVEVGITRQGMDLLDDMDPEVEIVYRRLSRHLEPGELTGLSDLLERYRQDQDH